MSGAMVDIASILDNAKELDRLKKQLEEVFLDINKIHKKLQSAPEMHDKSGEAIFTHLRELYLKAKELSESEVNSSYDNVPHENVANIKRKLFIANTLMGQLDALPLSGLSATQRKKMEVNEQKKKRVKVDSDVPRGLPAIRNQLEHPASLKGEQVAARVTLGNVEKDEWVVVKVIHFDREAKEFDVLDEEPGDDEESVQRKYKLPMSCIIPFPKKGDPSSVPDFPVGRHVLAVYPGTTALYKATVVNTPRKRKTDDYVLEFDDDEEDGSLPQRAVPFYNVVPLPEGHRQ